MRKVQLIITALCLSATALLYSQTDQTATLEIELKGIRSPDGQIAVGLSRSDAEWPHDPSINHFQTKDKMKDGTLIIRINSLERGTYAIGVLDDENSNQKMDSFLGFPKEGYGFSRNPSTRLGRPGFRECSIELDQPFQKITIELRYTGKDRESEVEQNKDNE